MKKVDQRSLSWTIAFHSAIVMVLAMGAYAVLQFFLAPGHSVRELAFEHLSHAALLIVAVYGGLYFVLLRKVVRPVNTLCAKIYSFAGGDFRPASVDSNIREVSEIAEAINVMLAKIESSDPEVSLAELSRQAEALRALAHSSPGLAGDERSQLLDAARAIDVTVAVISKQAIERRQRVCETDVVAAQV